MLPNLLTFPPKRNPVKAHRSDKPQVEASCADRRSVHIRHHRWEQTRNGRHRYVTPDASASTAASTDKPSRHMYLHRTSADRSCRVAAHACNQSSRRLHRSHQPGLFRQTCQSTGSLVSTGNLLHHKAATVATRIAAPATTQRNRLDRRRSESWSFMGGTVARAASNDDVTCGSIAAAVIARARRYPRRLSAYRYHHP